MSSTAPLYQAGELVRYKGSVWQIDYASEPEATYLISGGDWGAIGIVPPVGVSGELAISVSVADGNAQFERVSV